MISSAYAIPIYLILLLVGLLIASFFISKELNINPLLLSALLFAPYIIRWDVLLNSQEILSLVVALFAVGLIIKRDSKAGIALALLGLSKYPGLILLPMIILLWDKKKILKASILFALTTAPWLLFNQVYFGNAFLGYWVSISAVAQNTSTITFTGLLNVIILYPIVILLLFVSISVIKSRKELTNILKNLNISTFADLDRRYKIIFVYLFLSLLGTLEVYAKVGDPQRFGYLLYGSLSILVALFIESKILENAKINLGSYKVNISNIAPYLVLSLSAIILLLLYASVISNNSQPWFYGTKDPEIVNAVSILVSHNFSNCATVSNAWPLLNYYHVVAYEPTICNASMEQYPTVLFRNIGPDDYCGKLINYSVISPSLNYSIYVPGNYVCSSTTG